MTDHRKSMNGAESFMHSLDAAGVDDIRDPMQTVENAAAAPGPFRAEALL